METAKKIQRAGEMYTEIGLWFKEAEEIDNIDERIAKASEMFLSIADLEEEALSELSDTIPGTATSGG